MKKELIYLAIPYTFNPELSFEIANKVTAKLMSEGKVVFSPISHSHHVADYLPESLRFSQSFWMDIDLPILSRCDRVIVVLIDENGMEYVINSSGCQSEIKEAERLNLPIEYLQYKITDI